MEKPIAYFCVRGLILLFLLSLFPRQLLCSYGYDLLRNYQVFLLNRETSDWPVLKSAHFEVKYQRGDEESAHLVLAEAESVYKPLGKLFGYYPRQKMPIAVYTDRTALNRVFGWGSAESAMGVYWAGAIRILSPQVWLSGLTGLTRDTAFISEGPVAHEYIHLLVDYKTGGNYPRWLTEGLAQYGEDLFNGAAVDDKKFSPGSFNINDLDHKFEDPGWQEYSYALSKDLVKYLVAEYGSDRLPLLLNALGEGDSIDRAFQDVIGMDLNHFIQGYKRVNGIA
jgi:hypothetical protein